MIGTESYDMNYTIGDTCGVGIPLAPVMRNVGILLGIVFTSMFFFPFSTVYFPALNTKMIIAAAGLTVLCFDLSQNGYARVNRDFITISGIALFISIISFTSIVVNSTYDTSYLTYLFSMWTWLGAAYFVVFWIRQVHGECSTLLIALYLAGASVLQCLLAIIIVWSPSFHNFVDKMLATEGFMGRAPGRLYGIGCALDVAGAKFAAVIVIMTFMIPEFCRRFQKIRSLLLYAVCGCVVFAIGCIIGRTTLLGVALSLPVLLYYLLSGFANPQGGKDNVARFMFILFCCIIVFSLLMYVMYQTNEIWRRQLRFGFEGFFNLIETGEWKIKSNSQLMGQFIFPDNISSWIIGDGYFVGIQSNPYYVGPDLPSDFYKGTDVGYSRLIFYFGLSGMIAFVIFMAACTLLSVRYMPQYRWMFFTLLSLAFLYWAKVASDMFPVFAPFLAAGMTKPMSLSENAE